MCLRIKSSLRNKEPLLSIRQITVCSIKLQVHVWHNTYTMHVQCHSHRIIFLCEIRDLRQADAHVGSTFKKEKVH